MLEILNDILEAERKADEAVSAAREQAAKLKAETDSELSKMLAEARETTREASQKRIEDARNRAEERRREAENETSSDSRTFLDHNDTRVREVVRKIVDLIRQPEYRRG